MNLAKKILRISFYCLTILIAAIFLLLCGSYPSTSGSKRLSGLENPVRIERDRHGIPTIFAKNRLDVARATGFVHAQDRFFQMDLLRRMPSGELSEIFGPAALNFDKERRFHSFRTHARTVLSSLSSSERQLLHAYTEGVNAGLNALYVRPFEYLLLREKPRAWTEEDSVLVGLELYFSLQDAQGHVSRVHEVMKRCLPPDVNQFLAENGSSWDSPLDHSSLPIVPIPPQESFRYIIPHATYALKTDYMHHGRGSNQWAVRPSCTKDGRAFVACDMHLSLSVPNIWYRMAFEYPDETGTTVRLDGVAVPGAPLIVSGSNRHIAWGFTNGTIETSHLIPIEVDPTNPSLYITEDGSKKPFEEKTEEIKVKGSSSVYYTVRWSKWGPIHPTPLFGKQVAVHWLAHAPDCFNLKLMNLETTKSTAEALKTLPSIHIPVLNFIAADRDGHIGWGLAGGTPKEILLSNHETVWTTDWEHENCPTLLDPTEGRLWTANNRVISNPTLGSSYLNAIRAFQIKKRLFATSEHSIDSMYSIQLDEEAYFFDRWAELLKQSLDPTHEKHRNILKSLQGWDHRCSASSKGFFWIRLFRRVAMRQLTNQLLSSCLDAYPDLNLSLLDFEEPFYLILSQKPSYLVDPAFGSWEKEFSAIIDTMIETSSSLPDRDDPAWGDYNISAIRHPLSKALPLLSPLLDMPKTPLGGDFYVPRVAGPTIGASMRMVVSPGNEEEGILNMPCGQSGHPLSPQYRDQHTAWLKGIPTPFLPEKTKHTLELIP